MSIWPVLATSFGIQAFGFALAAPLQTDRFYDLTGSLTFVACIGVSLLQSRLRVGSTTFATANVFAALKTLHYRQAIVSVTTLAWCTRLGSFLAYRISKDKKDSRFDKIKTSPARFAAAWFLQGLWVFITAYPVYIVNLTPSASLAKLGLLDACGVSLWVLGFAIEAIADYQKLAWAARIGEEKRKTEFIKEGLWSISRHPNYFGEILLWSGSAITCASGFLSASPARALSFAISPIFVTSLLYKISGIPLLEKSSDKRFGHLEAYQKYKRETPELVPFLLLPYRSSPSAKKSE